MFPELPEAITRQPAIYGLLSCPTRKQVGDFVTGPETQLIAVRVMRVPGNPLIKGTFWLDDVQLAAIPTAESNH